MTDNDKYCPPPKEIQDFQFKQASIDQICDEFQNSPANSSLITADVKRGLLYIGQENKLFIVKPKNDSTPEWKHELNLQERICQIGLSCDCSLLVATFDYAVALIYDTSSIDKHKLNLLHKIRLSASGQNVVVTDIKWNPAVPELLCSVCSDHTIACFQISKDKTQGVQIIGMEKTPGFDALSVSWSPKGKQIVVGCKNGDIVQLKPELKVARHLSAPNPSEGMIISILWVSNYQFCACYYHSVEQRISVMIVDAPKGATTPKFTNYEDVTFGSGSMENIYYYFEHIPEWGMIIAASTHSSEVAVLGTSDNGATWNLYQLMDDSTAQLPLNRKKKIENYPVGVAIDKCVTQKLPWGESTLPNPVPILRILVTSGQLCSFHMVNLKENVAFICTQPTEFIPVPELPRPSIISSEVSFNLSTGATSTPRTKQNIPEAHVDKSKMTTNMFGNSAKSFSFLTQGSKAPQILSENETPNVVTSEPTQVKTNININQENEKFNVLQQDKIQKGLSLQTNDQTKKVSKQNLQPVTIQSETKPVGFPLKSDNKIEFKGLVIPTPNQTDSRLNKEIVKESTQKHLNENKSKEMSTYDEGVCLRAYYEEQARFEKELKSRLDLPSWNCGTDEERQILVKKTNEIDEFLRELKETTNSLASDIAYLKALLLQSFAWVEESKSKNSSGTHISNRNRIEGNKLADLQRLYYYTQSQLIQATKVLDLEWAEHNDRSLSRMKIPSLEIIYQSLIRYTQIIDKEKKNLNDLTKKWRNIERGYNTTNNLDKSMASLNLSQSSITQINDTAINLRCKFIASNTRSLSKDKQTKLRDLLSESAPTIVRAARPTAIQDRLEATLSSLASLKNTEATSKINKGIKSTISKTTTENGHQTKLQTQNSLASLNNLVSEIGTTPSPLSRSPNSIAPFSSFGTKSTPPKCKENVSQVQTQISFGTPKATTQSPKENSTFVKPLNVSTPVAVTSTNKFPTFSTPKSINSFCESTTSSTTPVSFVAVPKLDASIPFKFSTKSPEQQQGSNSEAKLDFSSLSFNARSNAAPSHFTKLSPAATTTVSKVSSNLTVTSPGITGSILPMTSTSISASPISTAPTCAFGTSTMFGALNSSSTSSMSFKPPPTGTMVTTSSSLTTTITTSVCPTTIPFGGIPSTAPSFAGILGSTNSLSFGSPTTTTSIVPAFSKGSPTPVKNIFGSTIPTSIFNKPDSSTSAASTTNSSSIFGNPPATTSAPLTFGTQGTSSTSENSLFSSKAVPSTVSSGSSFEGSSNTTPANSIFGNNSSNCNLPTFATANVTPPKTNVFEASTTTQSTGGLVFGTTSITQTTGTSGFGNSSTTPSTGSLIFGISTTTQNSSIPVFGNNSTTQSSGTSVFGSAATTSNSGASVFGTSSVTSSIGSSMFATPSTTQAVTSIFGNITTQSNCTSIFGTSSTTQSSGTTGFFANTTQGTVASPFGNTSTIQTNSTSLFGGNAIGSTSVFSNANSTIASPLFKPAVSITTTTMGATTTIATNPGIFGSPASSGTGSIFSGGTAAPGSSVFSSNTTQSTSIFGTPQSTPTNVFGAGTTTTSGSQPIANNLFGTGATTVSTAQPATTNLFGSATANPVTSQPPTGGLFGTGASNTGNSIFGAPPNMGTSMFGGAASTPGAGIGSSSVFGQPSAFGTKPVFGSPATDFGAAKPSFNTGFNSPPAFGSPSGAVFGSPSLLGSGTPLAGTSPNKVFGSSTFEALGSQSGGLSFDSLAQKTPGTEKTQAFQGSSSFSSWR